MTRSGIILAVTLVLSGCAVGPNYKQPSAPTSDAYKEQAGWKIGEPNETVARGAWWEIYGDPVLNDLENQVVLSNQNVKSFEAAYRQARAVVQEARASFLPTITGSGAATRSQRGVSATTGTTAVNIGRPINQFSVSAGGSWDIDVWGRIRRTVESDVASAQASAADLANATLSYQGTLATAYFELRVQDELKYLLDQSVIDYTEALKIARNKYAAGIVSKADVDEAETQLKSTQAQASNAGLQRAQLEHAIAVLIGRPPAALTIAPLRFNVQVPEIPIGVPSTLLERRPDVAAAERRVAAANAQIGVAIAAFFPDLTVSGNYGVASSKLDTLFQTSSRVWSVGPNLAMTLFDAGAHSAEVGRARAAYDQEVATYRQTVLTALSQVEDQLVALTSLASQADLENDAVKAAREAERITFNQYKAGTVDYTSVITAQTAALTNQQAALTVRRSQLAASVSLIQALGGGWTTGQLLSRGDVEHGKPPFPLAPTAASAK
ncbi:MAG: efflux transporter outer membrane subunit [Rhodospirillaceae bacterium]|nr:MAG: efflux transporter outer membrane subunit [Rhodospirillaceae bacterium]